MKSSSELGDNDSSPNMTPAIKRTDSEAPQIDSFVNKRIKATMQFAESGDDIQLPSVAQEIDLLEHDLQADSDLPSCWNADSAKHFKQKYPWMVMKDGKLGCNVCAEIKDGKSSHSENWIQCQVVANGNTKLTQQSSLRKKLFEHSKTTRHMQMVKIIDGECRSTNWLDNPPPSNSTDDGDDSSHIEVNGQSEEILVTARIFLVVYNLCQQNRPMVDIEGQINMLKAMKVNVGHCLHSRFTAIRIVDHIGQQMKRQILQKVISQEAKITIVVEEAVMKILQKPTFLLLFHCILQGHQSPFLLFLDLFELQNCTSHELNSEIFSRLSRSGFDNNYLWRNMLSPIYSLSTRTRDKFPDVLQTLPTGCDQSHSCMQGINVNSNESERLLNLLTQILTEERNRLNTEHIANLMIIKSIGKPIIEWDPIPYVRTWVRNHRNALDTRIKNHVEKAPSEYSKQMWTLVD